MVQVHNFLEMVISTQEAITIVSFMGQVFSFIIQELIIGKMDPSISEILLMGQEVGKENGLHQLIKLNLMNIKDNMTKIKKMDLEFINGLMVPNMKAFSKMI